MGQNSQLTAARWAVAALFFTNGALYANVAPRFPEIKTALGMSDALYGLSIAAFAVGALVAGLGAAVLIRRWGAPLVALISTALTGAAIMGVGLAPVPVAFMAGMFVAGAMDAITDVAQNDHGLRVQEAMGKSIINGFHATWSIGAVTGGAMAAAAIALGLPLQVHLALSAVVFTVVALVAKRFCLPPTAALEADTDDDADEEPSRAGGLTGARVLVLVAITGMTVASTLVEDLGSSWASLYLRDSLGLPGQVAAFGLVAVAGSQFVGRLLGDTMVDRWGEVTMARVGGALVALGMGAALAFPSPALTFLGFIAAGFGVATLVPSAFHAADRVPGLTPGTGLTVVAWLMRVSFLVAPPLIGFLSDQISLRFALGITPLIGLVTILLAPVLNPNHRGEQEPEK